jgi:hypothetical protein
MNLIFKAAKKILEKFEVQKPSQTPTPFKSEISEEILELRNSEIDQKDFREFLYPMGVPELITHVEFLLAVSSEFRPIEIYNRFFKSFATEKIFLPFEIQIILEKHIKTNKDLESEVFNDAISYCAKVLFPPLCVFYKLKNKTQFNQLSYHINDKQECQLY